MNIIRVKQPGPNTWQPLKSAFVKTNNGWQSVKTMYVKTDDTTWVPLVAGTKPIISSINPNPAILSANTNQLTTVKGTNFYGELVLTLVYTAVGDPNIRRLIIPTSDINIIDRYTLTFKTPNLNNSNVSNAGGSFISAARKITNTVYEEGNAVLYPLTSTYNFSVTRQNTIVRVNISNSGFFRGSVTFTSRGIPGRNIPLDVRGNASATISISPQWLNSRILPYSIIWPDGKTFNGNM